MLKWVLVIMLLVASTMLLGCAAQQQAKQLEPSYVGQGVNVTECGPAVAAMLVNFAGGQSSVEEARRLAKKQDLFTFDDVENHLVIKGIPYQVLSGFRIQDALQERSAAAVLINIGIANHWVVAYELRGNLVRVADPLFGMRWDSVKSFDQRAVPLFIKVERE